MASFGKATMAVVAGAQETTLALANLNFDFSLYKVEAPAEYKAVGELLSPRRRTAAESGMEHVIARRLGALFSRQIPSTPNLIRAYGIRASEIIKVTTDNPTGSSHGGIFQEWAGPDATSIWAAATSGHGAIAIHMLACMLARIWSASEAESIWDEIIQTRKKEIEKGDPTDPIKSLSALANIEVTREHLSNWDSSARAWLEVADSAKMRQQKQLLLLTKRTEIPIDPSEGVYASVMEAWRTALIAMENMVSGMSQSIQDGSVILALTSWHLYPDMYVLEAGPNRIAQNDPLVPPGGVITLGISSHESKDQTQGVHWSLPLAFLKYYGDPVPSKTTLEQASTRLSFSEFFSVVLGSILSTWGQYRHDVTLAARIIFEMGEVLTAPASGAAPERLSRTWLCLLASTAETYLASSGIEKQHLESLVMRGIRRCEWFLASPEDHPPSVFGLSDIKTLLGLIPNVDHRITLLRAIAAGIAGGRPDTLLIRYRGDGSRSINIPNGPDSTLIPQTWEYASALPKKMNGKKRKRETQSDDFSHTRWVENLRAPTMNEFFLHVDDLAALALSRNSKKSFAVYAKNQAWTYYDFVLGDPDDAAIFRMGECNLSGPASVEGKLILEALNKRWIDDSLLRTYLESLGGLSDRKSQYLTSLRSLAAAAEVYKLMPTATITTGIFSISLKDALWVSDCKQSMLAAPDPFVLLPGAKEGAQVHGKRKAVDQAAATPRSTWKQGIMGRGSIVPKADLDARLAPRVLKPDHPAPARLFFHSLTPFEMDQRDEFVQDEFVASNRNMQATGGELTRHRLSRSQSFACIAMLENQNVNLDPRVLKQVMALASGNSIYVATPLICDPFDDPNEHEIKRIVGNIGKPGISLMIPPMDPKVRKVDETKWSHISHARFDGNLDDAFQHTSLHLSFTRYKLPAMTSHGYQAVAANFVETPVSIFDRGDWIADVDILKAMNSANLKRKNLGPCDHNKAEKTHPAFPLTSIDSWDELLDLPPNPRVFRARKNWLARLAGTALSLQRGVRTVVLQDGEPICWKCVQESSKENLSYCDDKRELLSPLFIA